MGGKRHPLDVFRTSDSGFKKASRRRRTVAGRVIASSVKRKPAPPGRSSGVRGKRRWSLPSVPSLASVDGSRLLFYLAAGFVAVLALVVVLQQSLSGDDSDLPVLKKEDVLSVPAAAASTVGTTWLGIQACQYTGTDNGQRLAFAAMDELAGRGFPDVVVVGFPDPDEDGRFRHLELVVGLSTVSRDLDPLLERLRAVSDWSGGKPAPFVDALIIPHPDPGAVRR